MKVDGRDEIDQFDIGFEQFKLKPGLELEVYDESTGRLLERKAQFVSAHAGRDLLLAIVTDDPTSMTMEAGKRYRISGFSGKFDFVFSASALKVDRVQFTVLFETPATVSVHFVRKHRRTELAVPTTVIRPGINSPVPVTLRNLGPGGASMTTIKPMGAIGDSVTLRIPVTFDGKQEILNLASVIRRVSEQSESLMFNTGVEFVNASRDNKLLLHYYISTLTNEFDLI